MGKPNIYSRSISQSSNESNGSADAPTSVMCVPESPLNRELSDLSGSYMNGNTAPRRRRNSGSTQCGVPTTICSNAEASIQGPWRQACVLSAPPPKEKNTWQTAIVVERNGVIELVKNSDEESGDSDDIFLGESHPTNRESPSPSRIPLIILLMDPGRKQYELMRLWVDTEMDTVRDVLHALQHKLSDKWKQDYDGLFQLRGDHYCQLVHILSIAKYDLKPQELWVAKPWSMAAKTTTDLADDCIRQLRAGGLVCCLHLACSIFYGNSC